MKSCEIFNDKITERRKVIKEASEMTYKIWNKAEIWIVNFDCMEEVEDFVLGLGIQLSAVHIDMLAW